MAPDHVAARERPKRTQLARMISLLAPERWKYERRYTNIKHTTAATTTDTITLPSHSGTPPGFLSKRTAVPMSTPIIRRIAPAETTVGTDKAISNVANLSGFGSRRGDNVASRSPYEKAGVASQTSGIYDEPTL
uniref:Uncharacterized protein n=1 Tax=Opuntia streptacantha TaxID=393608 RepID=A0A7C9A3T1_OPUST